MKIEIGIGYMEMDEIATLCGGTLVGKHRRVGAICTDSREAGDGETLFVVLKGERVDAHDYMRRAYDGGCRLFLCGRIPEEMADCDFCAVVTKSPENALGDLAKAYKHRLETPSVAVTGSVGKTTTKEFIAAVLSQERSVHKTKANHNSTVGLPMSMMEADGSEDISIVEMGMSGLGEIRFMSNIAAPTVACVTNIGSSHLELLGTRENICRAKLEIAEGMTEDGVLLLNGDEPLLRSMCPKAVHTRWVSLEDSGADFYASNIRYDENGSRFDIAFDGEYHRDIQLSVIGRPFVWAASFAIAVARQFDMDMEAVRRGLLAFQNAAMRQNITVLEGITLIEDCYNASPESVRAAIDVMRTLAEHKGSRMVAVLGDMRELGNDSASFHRFVGEYYVENGGKMLFTVGELAENIAKGAESKKLSKNSIQCFSAYDSPEAVAKIGEAVADILSPGDILLVKASRAIGAERILTYIKKSLSGDQDQ